MIHTVFRALRRLQPRRCLPGCACFLGALAMAILAGCNSSSGCGGMGGGSGYQVDGMPGLMSCSTTSSTSTSTNATDTIVQGMTMTFHGVSLNMFGTFSPPAQTSATYADITGITTGTTSGLSGNTVSYSEAVSGINNVGFVYCSLQGATEWHWNTTGLNLATSVSPFTLSVTYPMFTMSPVVLECQYFDQSQMWWSNVAMGPSSTP